MIWNEKTNFKKYISFFTFDYWIEKRKTKKNCFWIYFDSKSISKNKNQNFRIHFLISNQKLNLKKFFYFSILVMNLKNEKWKLFKIRFVFKSKNELYFRYTDLDWLPFSGWKEFWFEFLIPSFVFHFHKNMENEIQFVFRFLFSWRNWKRNYLKISRLTLWLKYQD